MCISCEVVHCALGEPPLIVENVLALSLELSLWATVVLRTSTHTEL